MIAHLNSTVQRDHKDGRYHPKKSYQATNKFKRLYILSSAEK